MPKQQQPPQHRDKLQSLKRLNNGESGQKLTNRRNAFAKSKPKCPHFSPGQQRFTSPVDEQTTWHRTLSGGVRELIDTFISTQRVWGLGGGGAPRDGEKKKVKSPRSRVLRE